MRQNQRPIPAVKLKPRQLPFVYTLALCTIIGIVLIWQLVVQQRLADHQHDAQVINMAGRQRMLSQSITKAVLKLKPYQSSDEREAIADELSAALRTWQVTQSELQRGSDSLMLPGVNSDAVRQLFSEVEATFVLIQRETAAVIEQLAFHNQVSIGWLQPHIDRILSHEGVFVNGMDRIIQQYVRESNQRVKRLSYIDYAFAALLIVLVLAELMLLFRPTALRVSRMITRAKDNERRLKKQLRKSSKKKPGNAPPGPGHVTPQEP